MKPVITSNKFSHTLASLTRTVSINKLILSFICVLISISLVRGQNNVDIEPNPSQVSVSVGDTFTVVMYLESNGNNQQAAQIGMNYDPAIVQVDNVSLISAPENILSFELPGTIIDNESGFFYIGGYSLSPTSQSFDFVLIEGTALNAGTTSLVHETESVIHSSVVSFNGQIVTGSLESVVINIDCSNCTLCPGDLNYDGYINTSDLLILLGTFGCIGNCNGDLNNSGNVNTSDLLVMLSLFGSDCVE